ncbi:MAG: iron-containing alcohol dehydrogenase [Rectinemataceae bacterium]|jgi:alcohol dehydrogenase class IV
MRILPTPNCLIGVGAINQIPEALKELGVATVLVVTDPGLVKVGIFDKVKAVLEGTGIGIELCDRVQPDPSITFVQSVVEESRQKRIGAVIGLGGGSAIDTAKVTAALVTNQGEVAAYLGGAPLTVQPLPIIAVPTTAGTGSETTNVAILSDEADQVKKGLTSVRLVPSYAFLDPELTIGLPPSITAVTGMDALCHAIESYTSVNANAFSEPLSLAAVELIDGNIVEAFTNGGNVQAREKMLLGSYLAGMAFSNVGVTAVHAFAYPLGGMFHVAHGMANSLMLSTIIKFNAPSCEERFARIGRVFSKGAPASSAIVLARVEELLKTLKFPANLAAIDIPADSIEKMSQAVVLITRLLKNNPRPVTLDDARSIYKEAYGR